MCRASASVLDQVGHQFLFIGPGIDVLVAINEARERGHAVCVDDNAEGLRRTPGPDRRDVAIADQHVAVGDDRAVADHNARANDRRILRRCPLGSREHQSGGQHFSNLLHDISPPL